MTKINPTSSSQMAWPLSDSDARHATSTADGIANRRPLRLSSTLIQDENALAAICEEWDTLLEASDTPSAFFLSSICILPFWRSYGAGRALVVVLVRDGEGKLVGIAPFYIEKVGRRLSRHRRLALLGSPESGADYLDVIARPGSREAVLRETFQCLKRNHVRWDAINLDYILDNSPTLDLLNRARGRQRFRVYRKPSSICPYAKLPPTWDEFVAGLGSSTRRGMKYQLNLLRRKFKEVRFDLCADEREIREMLRVLLEYQWTRYGRKFAYNKLAWPEQAIAAQRAGYLRFWVLRLDGHPACLWFTFLYARRVFFQACSYDPAYAKLRLGKVMMPHAIRSAIEEGAVEYDMKRGDAPYKDHWSNAERRTVQVNAVRRSLRGVGISFWEYGPVMAGVRNKSYTIYRKARRRVRLALTPVAQRWPKALPERLRVRVLQSDTMLPQQGCLARESG